MPIYLWHNKILVDDGKLAAAEDCCCDDIDCPPCCVQLTGGTFNGSGDLVFTDTVGNDVMTVTVIMPSKNKRVICDNEQITIEMNWSKVTGVPAAGASPDALATWGQSWIYRSISPSVNSSTGYLNEHGRAWWDDKPDEHDYELVLEYDHCWTNYTNAATYAAIHTEFTALGTEVDLIFTVCPGAVDCCTDDSVCEPCCARIAPNDAQPGGGEFDNDDPSILVFWTTSGGRALRVEVAMPDIRDRNVCSLPTPETIDVTAYFIALDANEQLTVPPEMKIQWEDLWEYQSHTPAIGGGGSTDTAGAGHVDWGDAISASFSVTLEINLCDGEREPLVTVTVQEFGLSIIIPFFVCPSSDKCCPCCDIADSVSGFDFAHGNGNNAQQTGASIKEDPYLTTCRFKVPVDKYHDATFIESGFAYITRVIDETCDGETDAEKDGSWKVDLDFSASSVPQVISETIDPCDCCGDFINTEATIEFTVNCS